MRFLNYILLILLAYNLFASPLLAQVPDANAANSKIKAIFLYNFTKYIEWPASYKQGDFVIGVLGSSPLVEELEKMALKSKVGTQSFIIKKFKDANEVSNCHMLYISNSKASSMEAAINKLKKTHTLIITECGGCAKKGSAINFVSVNNKQRFELNKINAGKFGLQVSSNLATLAIMVD